VSDAFTVSFSMPMDCVTIPRQMVRPHLRRIGFGTVAGYATKRQKRLCEQNGHPKHAAITRGGVPVCARCRREVA
jgi:hypothetical protein